MRSIDTFWLANTLEERRAIAERHSTEVECLKQGYDVMLIVTLDVVFGKRTIYVQLGASKWLARNGAVGQKLAFSFSNDRPKLLRCKLYIMPETIEIASLSTFIKVRRRWDVATQEEKVCNMEIEIVTWSGVSQKGYDVMLIVTLDVCLEN